MSTGRIYIGSTVDFAARRAQHFSSLRKGNHHSKFLQRTYKKRPQDVVFEPFIFCKAEQRLEFEQILLDVLKPEFNTELIAGARDPEKMRGELNVMARPDVRERHKTNVRRGESHPWFGFAGDKNVMARPDVRERHKTNVPKRENHPWFGFAGDKNVMARPDVRERHKTNVRRGSAHPNFGRTGDKNVMARPDVRRKQKENALRGDKNPIHRAAVKEKIRVINGKTETKRRRSLSQATISENLAREIYSATGSYNQIAEKFKVTYNLCYSIRNKLSWKHIHE